METRFLTLRTADAGWTAQYFLPDVRSLLRSERNDSARGGAEERMARALVPAKDRAEDSAPRRRRSAGARASPDARHRASGYVSAGCRQRLNARADRAGDPHRAR